MRKILSKILVLAAILFISSSITANAAIVECGNDPYNPCTYDDLLNVAGNIVHFMLFDLGLPLVVVMVVWGGILILTSGGDEGKVRRGKDIITAAFVGITIAFVAWLIVTTVKAVFFK